MTRRLDLYPSKKLRNPGRHLRQLARWPEWIAGDLAALGARDPEAHFGGRFVNFKVPVFQKLVDPPHATLATQLACLRAIFDAAQAVEKSDKRPADCRVACLVSTPSLFNSEVTVFFDEDYFRSFLPREEGKRNYFDDGWIEDEPVEAEALGPLRMAPPEGMEFFGGTLLRQYDPAWGRKPVEQVTWVWAYPRR